MGKGFSFVAGAVIGAAAGTVIGILMAPRSGAETRAMAADMANDAWDNARDIYEQGVDQARAGRATSVPWSTRRPTSCAPRSIWPASAWISFARP